MLKYVTRLLFNKIMRILTTKKKVFVDLFPSLNPPPLTEKKTIIYCWESQVNLAENYISEKNGIQVTEEKKWKR